MILIRQQGAMQWHTPAVTAYDNEQSIQRIIEQSPHPLPGADSGPGVVASRISIEG